MSKINEYLITTMAMSIPAMVIAEGNKLKTRTGNVGKNMNHAVIRVRKDTKNTANTAEKQTR